MKYKHLLSLSFLSLLSQSSFAFFCPTNFNQIDFGLTIAQVISACGQPASQTVSVNPNENVPQEWNYYIPQTTSTLSTNKTSGALKTSVTFDASGKVINITVNGFAIGGTTICGRNIQLGDTRDAVKAACGSPSIVNRQTATDPTTGAIMTQQTKSVQLLYKSNPPVTLIFENGVLTSKQ